MHGLGCGRPRGCKSDSMALVQEAYTELASLEEQFRSRADSSQAQLQKLVDTKEKREQELYIKV